MNRHTQVDEVGMFAIGMMLGALLLLAMLWEHDSLYASASNVCGYKLNEHAPVLHWYVAKEVVTVGVDSVVILCGLENMTTLGTIE